jgi:SHS2 domain-containing protein
VELIAEGRSLPEAFARIALDLFAAAVDPDGVADTEVREVRAHGPAAPALLRRWLEECLYVHEVEGFTCRAIEFAVFDETAAAGGEPLRLHAFLRGEPVDPARHRTRGVIRGIGAREITVDRLPGGFRLTAGIEI